jgi:hypothetical protein
VFERSASSVTVSSPARDLSMARTTTSCTCVDSCALSHHHVQAAPREAWDRACEQRPVPRCTGPSSTPVVGRRRGRDMGAARVPTAVRRSSSSRRSRQAGRRGGLSPPTSGSLSP